MPATRTYRPTTPGLRRAVRPTFEEVTKQEPEQNLLRRQLRQAGRNNRGVITVRHRGGGHKRMMRVIDFRRDNVGVPGTVQGIEYDPNRSARLALIQYRDGDKRYILAPQGLSNGDKVESGPDVELSLGNALPLRLIPLGTVVHNVELTPGTGGQMVRSAGTSAQVLAREEFYSLLRLPSGEIHRVLSACMATIGQLGNQEHKNLKLGKAGRSRHMGRRPVVRGSAMSPRDHPHGGGEGRSPIGMPGPKTPWGKPALGYKTRRNKRTSGMIVRGRRRKS